MIELNLLPDVKMEYMKAERTRRLVISVAFLVTAVSVGLLALVLVTNALQKKHIQDLSNDINTSSRKLQSQPQINRILTVQNQLQSLTNLHDGKPAASRLVDYLNQLTPNSVSISNLTVDFTQQTATITGSADALSSVNKYVDTLKFTSYNGGDKANAPAFSNVVMSSFGLATDANNGKPASYTVNLSYDKAIFDITKDVKLNVPNLITTRSSLSSPSDLFQATTPASTGSSSTNQGAH
jgi:hypothetical protein